MADTITTSTEDWNSYRKLVISALERLESCAEKMRQVMIDLTTRAIINEKEISSLKQDLIVVESQISELRIIVSKIQETYVTQEEFLKLNSKVDKLGLKITMIVGTIMMFVTAIVQAASKWIFPSH